MAWESTDWACGHSGEMQLTGPYSGRSARVAYEAGRPCMACWLIGRWTAEDDPRATSPQRWDYAQKIAEEKGRRIQGGEIKEAKNEK